MWIGNQMCRFCHDQIESEIYVLRDCLKAMAISLCVVDFAARTSFLKVVYRIGLNLICLLMSTRNHNVEWRNFWARYLELEKQGNS